jgi:hypothetical protein
VADEPCHSFPRDASLLASSPKHVVPGLAHGEAKVSESVPIARHSVVPDVSAHHSFQPLADFRNRFVHASPQFGFDRLQLGLQPFSDGLPQHGPSLPSTSAVLFGGAGPDDINAEGQIFARTGRGNSSGGFWHRTQTVNQCAAKNAASLASVFHWNQNNFWVNTFAGNDASTLSNIAFGPGRGDALVSASISNPTKYSLSNMAGWGIGQIPTGSNIYVAAGTVATPYGAAIEMVPTGKTVGMVAGKAVGVAAEAVTAVKAVFDVGAYIYAEIGCAAK